MKKTYYIPTIDVVILSSHLMQLATGSDKGSVGAPKRRVEVF